MDKQRLTELIDKGYSIRKIVATLPPPASFSNVRYWLKKFGLQTKTYAQEARCCKYCQKNQLTGRKKIYCSLRCQADDRQQTLIDAWRRREISGHTGKTLAIRDFVRRFMISKSDHKCSKCGWNTPHPKTGRPPLEVNHIDGNAGNTWEENLEVLCPNCHSLTPTYKNRNKGSGKRNR